MKKLEVSHGMSSMSDKSLRNYEESVLIEQFLKLIAIRLL